MLFVEGQSPRGVFILCSGKVKLSTSSADGKTLILRISEIGEVLGLAAVVSGKAFQATAEVLEPTQANFIGRREFLEFLREHGEAACAWPSSWPRTTITPWAKCGPSVFRIPQEKNLRDSCWTGSPSITGEWRDQSEAHFDA